MAATKDWTNKSGRFSVSQTFWEGRFAIRAAPRTFAFGTRPEAPRLKW